jgi:HK97 family phage portal protein
MSVFENALRSVVSTPTLLGAYSSFGYANLTQSAKKVNVRSSLTISAFYSGVDKIANSIAILPHSVVQKTEDTIEVLDSHAVHGLLNKKANYYQTPFNFKHLIASTVLLRGNYFAGIVRDDNGKLIGLDFWDHNLVTVIDYNDELFYLYKENTYKSHEVLHVPGFSFDGKLGKSILEFAADNMGTTLNAQKFGSSSLENQGLTYGVIETEKKLDSKAKDAIGSAFEKRMTTMNKHRAAVLDETMKYKKIGLNPEESKFIETYANGIEDIARWLHVPNHKLNIKGEGGYNSLIQMEQEYLQTAVKPLAQKIKEEFDAKLFTDNEKNQNISIDQNFKILLQVDPKSRAEYYKSMVFLKAMTPNEIRKLESMNPYDDGDQFLQMSNLLNEQQLKKLVQDENPE